MAALEPPRVVVPVAEAEGERAPVDLAEPEGHIPGLARRDIPAPSWWKGDRAAWQSNVRAAEQLDEPAAKEARRPPRPGSRG